MGRRICSRKMCKKSQVEGKTYCRFHHNLHEKQSYRLRQKMKRRGITCMAEYPECKTCKKMGIKKKAVTIDHHHTSGDFRGFLCKSCNRKDTLK